MQYLTASENKSFHNQDTLTSRYMFKIKNKSNGSMSWLTSESTKSTDNALSSPSTLSSFSTTPWYTLMVTFNQAGHAPGKSQKIHCITPR